MFGKIFQIFIRICMALKVLNVACIELIKIPEASDNKLSQTFWKICKNITNHECESRFIIEIDITIQAVQLTEYFNKTKLLIN